MTAVGDVVLLRADVEMHRPPRRYLVEAIQGSSVNLSPADVCDCHYRQHDHGCWIGASAIASLVMQDSLW